VIRPRAYLAVCGPGDATPAELGAAEEVGREIADSNAVLVCGGLGGVMEAACRGAARGDGLTVGLLPGADRSAGNEYLTLAIPTGLGELRNGLIVRAVDAVIAIGGAYGTLSEVALALKTGTPVIGLDSFDLPDMQQARSPADAVGLALATVA
jgi:uncharacterized protein (TIGR00725 family)